MSFIQFANKFSEVKEKRPVARAVYDLRVVEALEHSSKESGKPSILVKLEVEGEDAPIIWEYLSLPTSEDDEDKVNNKMRRIARFLSAFNIPHEEAGFNIEDFFGATGRCEVILTDPADEQDGESRNKVLLPKLKDESPVSEEKSSRRPPKRG